jgi:small-conductance mechanosensitive channel
VRNIAVRATEIETADKASLIVPNSELITTTVTNWTHRNALFRVTIRVSVGYDSDPDEVRKILLRVAAQCPDAIQHPPPEVVFENFGASGLDFALHTVIPDVAKGFVTQTFLRTNILREFRAAGIEIPFNQTDVHLRDLDFVKDVLNRMQQARPTPDPDAPNGKGTDPASSANPGTASPARPPPLKERPD